MQMPHCWFCYGAAQLVNMLGYGKTCLITYANIRDTDQNVCPRVSEIPSHHIKKALKYLESEKYSEFTP